jgi:hypothetical protein
MMGMMFDGYLKVFIEPGADEMKKRSCFSAILSLAFVLSGFASTPDKMDQLTGLPVYPGTYMSVAIPRATFCKSTIESVMYMVNDAKAEAVAQWYSARLNGFQRYHSNGNGRSQDTFFKPDGTVEVTVTGVPRNTGDLYSISFGRFQPPLPKRQMETFNQDKPSCN